MNRPLNLSSFQIRISISGEENSTDNACIRTYQPKFLEPSTRNTIVLSYAISSNERDALLFYLSSKTTVSLLFNISLFI